MGGGGVGEEACEEGACGRGHVGRVCVWKEHAGKGCHP